MLREAEIKLAGGKTTGEVCWSCDFVMDRTHDGRAFRLLTVIDDYSRQCLAIRTQRQQNQETVVDKLTDLFLMHGPPD